MKSVLSLALFMLAVALAPAASTQVTRIVEDIPRTDNLYHKAATKTPSGFAVPRFVSLKFGKVNGRTGPSRQHSIAWQYQRRGLPLLVVAETEMWRKVRDIDGEEAWVRKPTLSGDRYVLTLTEISLHTKPRKTANVIALTDPDALLKLEECTDDGWCRVRAQNGLKGWTVRHNLWGAQSLR